MIACKLAALAPERLCSLALLNATGGGFECFPKVTSFPFSSYYISHHVLKLLNSSSKLLD